MRQRVAFCHIHKTAGTTISTYLRSNYPPEEVFPATGLQEVTQKQIDQINDYALIAGHFPLSFLRSFLASDWKIVTVLRDPVKRFVSHLAFDHQLRHGGSPHVPPLDIAGLEDEVAAFSNFQTRFLGGWLSRDEWRYLVASRKAITYHLSGAWHQGTIESASRVAMEELQQIDWILDDNRVLQGLQRVALDCHFWPFEYLPHSNKGDYLGVDETPGGEALRAIAPAHNLIDVELYEAARNLVVQDLMAHEIIRLNANWMARYTPSRSCVVAADHGFMGTGWTGPYHSLDGSAFRWSDSSLVQDLYFPLTIAGHHEFELSIFLPDCRPGFSISIEMAGQRCEPAVEQADGDQMTFIFRPDFVIGDVGRLQRVRILADCRSQVRPPGGLPNAGFISNGAIARLLG